MDTKALEAKNSHMKKLLEILFHFEKSVKIALRNTTMMKLRSNKISNSQSRSQ